MNQQGRNGRRRLIWQPRAASAGTVVMALACVTLAAWLSHRYSVEADWTSTGRHALAPASLELLGRTTAPLDITAYTRNEPEVRDAVRRFIDHYRRHKPDIALQFINPDTVPDEVRNLGISVNGEMILKYEGRLEHVRSDSEQEFANALQRLLRPGERWLAFVEGHGERSALGRANHDLGLWAEQLRQRGYRVQPVNLAETRAIPDNTGVLVIAGPGTAYLPGEADLVRRYMERGGAVLWLADPGRDAGLPLLEDLFGVTTAPGIIIDTAGRLVGLEDPTITLVTASLYGAHPALKDFSLTTFFPTAGAIRQHGNSGWEWTALLTTGNHAWLETGPLQGDVQRDAGADLPGPLTIGAALTWTRTKGGADGADGTQRAVVVADGDFLSNTYVSSSGNLELGLRIINWLSRDEELISIPPRTAGDTQLDMSPAALGFLGIFFMLILPAAFLACGFSVWWRRSRL